MIRKRRAHAGAAGAGMPDFDSVAHTDAADSGRAHERLVARERQRVDMHRLHVDRHHAGGLRRVYDKPDVGRVANLADLRHRLNRPEDVRAVVDHHQFRILLDRLLDIVRVDKPVVIKADESGLDPDIAHQMIDRADDRVVLDISRDNMVARREHTHDQQIQGVGGVVPETEPFRMVFVAAEKPGQLLAQIFKNVAGFDRLVEAAAARIDPAGTIKVYHKLIDFVRFRPGRGRVIEIDQITFSTLGFHCPTTLAFV